MRVWTTLIVSITVALAVGVASATANGNSENAKLCQKGGWKTLGTSDGQPFVDQGACVSYAAQGGTLTPLPDLKLAVDSCVLSGTTVNCSFRARVAAGTVTGPVTLQARLEYPTLNADRFTSATANFECQGGSGESQADVGTPPTAFSFARATCPVTAAGVGTLPQPQVIVAGDGGSGISITVTAQVDPDNVIAEADETNNSFSQTFQVAAG